MRKNKYVCSSKAPICSVFNAISKRRFLHRKKLNTSCPRCRASSKRRFLHLRKGKFFVFLFTSASIHTILILTPAFPLIGAKRGFYTEKTEIFNQCSLSPTLYSLWVHGCTVISKREVSTPEKISRSNLHLSLYGYALPLLQREISTLRNL